MRETLLNQLDRGLDSLWIINKEATYKVLKDKYKGYKKYLRRQVREEWLTIMHHRKASIGSVNLDNAHPFEGNNFILMHNWTARKFFTRYGWVYKKDTDSETLLRYIEDKTDTIEEIPKVIEELCDRLQENLGNVIITDIARNKILFYTDWARESFLHFDWKNYKLKGIYNYKPWTSLWFSNEWSVILDFNFNIIDFDFKEINEAQYYYGYSWKYTLPPVTTIAKFQHKTWNYKTQSYYYDYEKEYEAIIENEYENYIYVDPVKKEYKTGGYEELNEKEQLEFDYVQKYLLAEYWKDYANDMQEALTAYLIYYYWVDTIESYNLYHSDNDIEIDKVFKLAYEECFFFNY